MKTLIKILLLSSMGALFVACESGSNSATPQSTLSSNNSAIGNHPDTVMALKTADLVASKDFDLTPSRNIILNINVADKVIDSARVSVCKDYTAQDNGGYKVDYNSCLVSAPLKEGKYQTTLKVTNEINKLISVIWFMNDLTNPQFNELDVANNKIINID